MIDPNLPMLADRYKSRCTGYDGRYELSYTKGDLFNVQGINYSHRKLKLKHLDTGKVVALDFDELYARFEQVDRSFPLPPAKNQSLKEKLDRVKDQNVLSAIELLINESIAEDEKTDSQRIAELENTIMVQTEAFKDLIGVLKDVNTDLNSKIENVNKKIRLLHNVMHR